LSSEQQADSVAQQVPSQQFESQAPSEQVHSVHSQLAPQQQFEFDKAL